MAAPLTNPLLKLTQIVALLRGEGGCAWDRAQTLASMRPYLLEETYEVLDALGDGGAPGPHLREELGDLLFVVTLLAQIAQDQGLFTLGDAAASAAQKMVERHPHVFGPEAGAVAGGTNATWEAAKARKRGARASALDGVPDSLPALLVAHRQGEKAAAVGFDWTDVRGALEKVREELAEVEAALAGGDPAEVQAEVGDLLLAVAHVGRHAGAPPEQALRGANQRFGARFREMERLAAAQGVSLYGLDPAALDGLWEEAKQKLRAGHPAAGG